MLFRLVLIILFIFFLVGLFQLSFFFCCFTKHHLLVCEVCVCVSELFVEPLFFLLLLACGVNFVDAFLFRYIF